MGKRGPKVGSTKPPNKKRKPPNTTRKPLSMAEKLIIVQMKEEGKSLQDMMKVFPTRTKSTICTVYSEKSIRKIKNAKARGVALTENRVTSHLRTDNIRDMERVLSRMSVIDNLRSLFWSKDILILTATKIFYQHKQKNLYDDHGMRKPNLEFHVSQLNPEEVLESETYTDTEYIPPRLLDFDDDVVLPSGSQGFQCTVCDKVYKLRKSYKKHLFTHRPDIIELTTPTSPTDKNILG